MEIYNTVGGIEGWAGSLSEGMGEDAEREVDTVRRLLSPVRAPGYDGWNAGSSFARDASGISHR